MAGKEELQNTLKRLNRAKNNSIPIVVDTRRKIVKLLINLLAKKEIIIILKETQNSSIVKVAESVREIEVLSINSTAKQVSEWANKLPLGKNGHLILTTSKGLVSHQDERKIGGIILGFIA